MKTYNNSTSIRRVSKEKGINAEDFYPEEFKAYKSRYSMNYAMRRNTTWPPKEVNITDKEIAWKPDWKEHFEK